MSARPFRRMARWCTRVATHNAAEQLTWFDRAGRALARWAKRRMYIEPRAFTRRTPRCGRLGTGSPENRDIWIIDIARNVPSRLTFDPGTDGSPVWSPDGTRIAFAGQRSGKVSLRQQLIDGTAPMNHSSKSRAISGHHRADWLVRGWAVHRVYADLVGSRLHPIVWVLPLFGDRKPFPLAQTAFHETSSVFSPDGRWIAYGPTKAARPTSSFNRFPRPAGNIQVSRDGGSHPVWRADGKELFYLGADGTMMAVSIDATGQFDCRSAAGPLSVPGARPSASTTPARCSQSRRMESDFWSTRRPAVQRGAADRRAQLDGRDPEITFRV